MSAAKRKAVRPEPAAPGGLSRQASIPLEDLAGLRAGIYRLLGQVFLSPSNQVLATVGSLMDEMSRNESTYSEFAFSPHLRELAQSWRNLDGRTVDRMRNRYVALFSTATGGVPCPPYESAYAGHGPGQEGLITVSVERHYSTAGLRLSVDQRRTPDHVSLQLEFMAILCDREAVAWEARDYTHATGMLRRQQRFLDEHLARWLVQFTARLESSDPGGPYAGGASAAQAFVTHDRDLVAELSEMPIITAKNGHERI